MSSSREPRQSSIFLPHVTHSRRFMNRAIALILGGRSHALSVRMILQSDLSEFFGKRHKLRILAIDMLHAVAQCVAYVKMMDNACILKAAYEIMRTVGYSVFRRTSGFIRGLSMASLT